jgi:hypothetical protein
MIRLSLSSLCCLFEATIFFVRRNTVKVGLSGTYGYQRFITDVYISVRRNLLDKPNNLICLLISCSVFSCTLSVPVTICVTKAGMNVRVRKTAYR